MKSVILAVLIWSLIREVSGAEQAGLKTRIYDTLAEIAGASDLVDQAITRYPAKTGALHLIDHRYSSFPRFQSGAPLRPDWPRQVSYDLNTKKPLSLGSELFHSATNKPSLIQKTAESHPDSPNSPPSVSYDLYPSQSLSSEYGLTYSATNKWSLPSNR